MQNRRENAKKCDEFAFCVLTKYRRGGEPDSVGRQSLAEIGLLNDDDDDGQVLFQEFLRRCIPKLRDEVRLPDGLSSIETRYVIRHYPRKWRQKRMETSLEPNVCRYERQKTVECAFQWPPRNNECSRLICSASRSKFVKEANCRESATTSL